ncbi:N-acetyltransferase B complex non catalytic subunit [Colletotrichum karsti]|uniref:N-acetyltransferase B complex non catalytic subunit n=1 Tax=Colletotrichum karsti TaxID=1095194 RepID=A0A9P6HU01_9PEZI|nr:N-acetyltransferase B complex non catalytic subunit [Colletotrichum karsti]KAF9870648.1 N-acetyltransferase B complex non catalytic subunit [Colletotrichum karsti]
MSWNRPQLKSGVDLQLQTAFNDGQWANVIRLAEKRFKTFNDPYYEVVKIVAESHLESPVEKVSPLIAVQKLVKDASAVRDADSLELLEWASEGFVDDQSFSETFGPLKLRYVKAFPKDKNGGTRCLESCLLHWDLVSAQQIAAVLDKSFPGERSFLFWNIAVTHLLATSDQCPAGKKQLYGMLALKQMQRAAQFAEQHSGADKNGDVPDRAIKTEEEILLFYRILEAHASDAEWDSALKGPTLSPVFQFKAGRKDLFLQCIDVFERKEKWRTVYDLCKECLSVTDEKGQLNLLACDWAVWKKFLNAAGRIGESAQEISEEVKSLINRFLEQENVRSIYKRNIYLARVEAAFQFAQLNKSSDAKSNEFQELCRYIDIECASPACFDDVKGFAERLPPQEIKELAYEYVPRLAKESEDASRSASVKALAFKLQYLGLSSRKTVVRVQNEDPKKPSNWKCIVCTDPNKSNICITCLKSVLEATLTLYSTLINSFDISPTLDCIPELAILASTCLVRLSGLHERGIDNPTSPSKSSRHDRLLQAALVIEDQLTRTPKHTRLTLILVRIYLVLGCASRAREVWDTADVKRTIIDSLGPYFFDRLSTIAPALVLPPNSPHKALMQGLKAHYQTSLKLRMPRRLADAFDSESYTAILDIPSYIDRLRKSCTLVMGYVEESRAGRALDVDSDPVFDEPAVEEIVDDTVLSEMIDYGSVPNLEATTSRPIYDVLRLGPDPSNVRSHLALSAETFFDLLSYRPPSSYKVANVAQTTAAEQTFTLESLQRLNTSMSRFLHARGKHLTQHEEMYYDIISLLTALVPLAVTASRSPPPPELVSSIVAAIKSGLEVLRAQSLSTSPETEESKVLLMLGSLHGLSVLRDAAAAVKLAMSHIVAFNEREKERDRSGQSNIPKDIMVQVKALEAAAATAMTEGKARVLLLKKESDTFNARLGKWTFEAEVEDKLAKQIREVAGSHVGVWTQRVADSWRTNVKGWELVQWQ